MIALGGLPVSGLVVPKVRPPDKEMGIRFNRVCLRAIPVARVRGEGPLRTEVLGQEVVVRASGKETGR
jgi:hypothetical protein